MKIIKISIITRSTDLIYLDTNLPSGIWASLLLEVAKGGGESYCAKNFPGIPVTVINTKMIDCGYI